MVVVRGRKRSGCKELNRLRPHARRLGMEKGRVWDWEVELTPFSPKMSVLDKIG